MVKKCPKNKICFEKSIFSFFILVILFVLLMFYINYNKNLKKQNLNANNINNNINTNLYKNNQNSLNSNILDDIYKDLNAKTEKKLDLTISKSCQDNYSVYNNPKRNNVLLDPYVPPFKDNTSEIYNEKIKKLPINIKTQSTNNQYNQIGILTRISGKETILPLMGRQIIRNRDTWNYYTMNDKNNMIKLPITFKNKKCMSDNGCENISTGDKVYVEGYNDLFTATIYDNNNMEYIPYL